MLMTKVDDRSSWMTGPITGRPLAEPKSERSFEVIQAELRNVRSSRGGLAWYIVHALGTDKHAIDWLENRKVENYYPAVREMRPIPKKRMSHKQRAAGISVMRPTVVPFFPRYIFVRFDMGKDGWREVFDYAGIGGMVCEGHLPVWVDDALIASIRSREVDGAVPGKTSARVIFKVGEAVTVTEGPFASFPGVVERGLDKCIEDIDPEDRIKVAVSIFGRSTPVDLYISQVEK